MKPYITIISTAPAVFHPLCAIVCPFRLSVQSVYVAQSTYLTQSSWMPSLLLLGTPASCGRTLSFPDSGQPRTKKHLAASSLLPHKLFPPPSPALHPASTIAMASPHPSPAAFIPTDATISNHSSKQSHLLQGESKVQSMCESFPHSCPLSLAALLP